MESYLSIHYAVKKIRHACTVISIIFAVPSLMVIVLCSKRVTKRYSLIISLIVMLGVANDLVLQWMWDPLLLAPAICILRDNPFIPLPGNSHLYYEVWAIIIDLNVPVFFACFLERHQAVQSPNSRWEISLKIRHFLTVSIVLISLSFTYLLRIAKMPSDSEQQVLKSLVARWSTVDVMRANCYDYHSFLIFDLSSAGCLFVCILFLGAISLHTFKSIRQTSNVSDATKSFHESMSKVLAIQALIPLVFIAFPLIASLGSMLAEDRLPSIFVEKRDSFFVVHATLCHLFVSVHSPIHSLVLLIATPMYRKKLLNIVKCVPSADKAVHSMTSIQLLRKSTS